MGKFDGWLICSDFDGTIYVDKALSDENCRAVKYFQDNGGRFTFASGRFTNMFDSFRDRIEANAPIAGLNGSVIADPSDGRILYSGGVSRDGAAEFAFGCFDDYPSVRAVIFYTPDSLVKVTRDRIADGTAVPAEVCAGLPETLSKIAVIAGAESSGEVFADITARTAGKYSISRSWVCGIEINDPADTKGKAVRRIGGMVGAGHIVCVGDYENDLSMIEAADIGYAVGNAVPALKAAADRITVDCHDHAIAAVILELDAELGV